MSPLLFFFEISLELFLCSKKNPLHWEAEAQTTDLSKLKKLYIVRAMSETQLSWLLV